METIAKRGSITNGPSGTEIRIERVFAHPPAAVWSYLTESSSLAQWLAPGTIEPRIGGAARLDFADSGIVIDSEVTEFIPQKAVAYSWSSRSEPKRPLLFALESIPSGTRLRLCLTIPKDEDGPRAAAGFEAHLEMLAAALEGVPIRFPFALFKELRTFYQAPD